MWTLVAVAVGALVIGGGVAYSMTGNSTTTASPSVANHSVNSSNSNSAGTSNSADSNSNFSSSTTASSGSGPAVTLKVSGDSITGITYIDGNGRQQTVSNPASGWSTTFNANSTFQEKLHVSGTGQVKCTLQIGGSETQSSADDSGGSATTCRGSVGN